MSLRFLVLATLYASCSAAAHNKDVHTSENKIEPIYKYGDTKAELSCSFLVNNKSFLEHNQTWSKNGVPLSKLNRSERFKVINGSLFISSPTRDDAGVYTAHFTNVPVLKTHDCHVRYLASPLVLNFPKSINVDDGSTLELKCIVKGYPHAVVFWEHDSRLINEAVLKNDSRYRLKTLNGYNNSHLIISDVKFSDKGIYECLAYSSFFNVTVSKLVKVRVIDRRAFVWPLAGLIGSFILLCFLILIFEGNSKKRIQKQEARLYRESFMKDEELERKNPEVNP